MRERRAAATGQVKWLRNIGTGMGQRTGPLTAWRYRDIP